ncbi:MAG: GAF domain-containing protein [Anaerolineae bacterium]|nr:GAF domain-containing protein [Anaerolineae bacterium]
MLRRRGIQAQIVQIIVIALIFLAAILQIVNSLRQRESLIKANRAQALGMAVSLHESIKAFDLMFTTLPDVLDVDQNLLVLRLLPQMTSMFNQGFADFVEGDLSVAFESLVLSNGAVINHSKPEARNKTAAELGIADLPLDRTVRRDIPGYAPVYLTRVEIDATDTFVGTELNFIVGIYAEPIDSELRQGLIFSGVAALAGVLLVSSVAAYMVRRGVIRPIHNVQTAALNFSQGKLTHRIDPKGSAEFYNLAETLNRMAGNLQQSREVVEALLNNMSSRVQSHDRDLQIAADIGRIAASLRDVDTLLQETVDQICARFETIYHAQIFLLDELGEYAVLVKSTGEAGRRLLSFGHKISVGSDSVIGRVTLRGQVVMVSDTLAGEVPWQPNPVLPHTRAEMALPLAIEQRVIGALDVQSIKPDVFTSEMVQVFGVLADQLAIAIRNAQLLSESERRVREIDSLNRQLTRSVWQTFVTAERGGQPSGYLYDQMNTVSLDAENTAVLMPQRTEVPIQVRGETIGMLAAAAPGDESLTDDDQMLVRALADRVALAIENARLFERTQRALSETERLYEAARTVSGTSALADIYPLVAEQIGTAAPSVDAIDIMLSGPAPTLIQYLEDVYRWQRNTESGSLDPERLQVPPLESFVEGGLPENEPLLYRDAAADMAASHPLYARLNNRAARSVLIAPLHAGGQWFGVVVCSGHHTGGFEAAYVSFVSALCDQLAIAIENRRLFEDAQAEARRARALAEAGQLASRIAGDYVSGLQHLFEVVAGPGGYDRWWFGLLSDDGSALGMVTESGIPLSTVDVQNDQHALAEVARIGEIVLINDPVDHPVVGPQDLATVQTWGKHIAMPIHIGSSLTGALLIGRGQEAPNLDERDIQLAATLASQVAVATQNQRLFTEAESQGRRLQTIVDTMPTGILVMDTQGNVLLANQNLRDLLGPDMRPDTGARPEPYPIVRTGTQDPYPRDEWPLSQVVSLGVPVVVDDMTVLHPAGYEISVLAQAAPITNAAGEVTAVVGAFQDITELQELERALQDSLRETTLLYEASQSISRANTMDELLDVTLRQIMTMALSPDRVYVFLQEAEDDERYTLRLVASEPSEPLENCALSGFSPMLGPEPIIVTASTAPDEFRSCFEQMEVGVLGSFPLRVHQYINGWIMVGFTDPSGLMTEQRRFMTTLADQAAVTVENQRLLGRTEAALENTARLYRVSRAIADAHGALDILRAFVNYGAPRPVGYAALYLLMGDHEDTTNTVVELAAAWGDRTATDPVGTRYQAERFAYWGQLTSRGITHFDDVAAAFNLDPEIQYWFTILEIEAAALIPLRLADRPVGVILIGLDEPWVHSNSQLRIYQSMADQSAISLENTRLYQQAERRARQLSTSVEIGRAVTSILSLDELLPRVVNQIREAFEYDHAQVFLLSEDGVRANLVASTGSAGQQMLAVRHSLPVGSQSVIGQVTETGKPQIALDTADAFVIHRVNPYLPDTRSEMALPLIARGQILGALDVQSNRPGTFTPNDVQILTPLADMVAIAINNARLYEVSQERAEEMAFLFNVTTAATTSSDLSQSLEQAVETLRVMMGVTSASIFLPDESGEHMIKGADVGATGEEIGPSLVSFDRGLIGWVARHREPAIIGDVAQDPRRLPTLETTQSVIVVPLQTVGRLVGVLGVESDKLNAFDDNDLRLLQALSGSLAAIIQNQQLLREVQLANERLLEVDRLKTNFLAAMSHELRTPLNSIIGFSRVILKGIDGPLTDTQEQDITTIYDSGKHLLGLVNDILDQAKIEAGKMELSFGYFKLQDVVTGVMSSAIGLTRDKPVRLHTDIAENLPDAYGDEFRTRQVLLNLVSNAAKFTPEGSISVSAFPIVEEGQQYLQVSVVDTGIGIAKEDMYLLFEAFQQVDNSLTRSVEGTGMGLPLAKSLTELQHGRIWVDSAPGIGSTFSITVPTGPQPEEGAEGQRPGDAATPVVREVDTPLIAPSPRSALPDPAKVALVIENNLEIISLYRHYLASAGYEVVGTVHAGNAVDMITAYKPNVVLLDVDVSEGSGWDVLARLSSTPETSSTPVIVSSMNTDLERVWQLGASGYLLKPFSESQLVDTVKGVEASTDCQHILLVDDKPETVRVFREALEASGQYCVTEATTGQQAMDIIQQPQTIDLVILDLRMPEVDGFEVLQMLRTNARTVGVPVLVLTAEDVNAEERTALQTTSIYRKDDLDEEHFLQQVEMRLGSTQENTRFEHGNN